MGLALGFSLLAPRDMAKKSATSDSPFKRFPNIPSNSSVMDFQSAATDVVIAHIRYYAKEGELVSFAPAFDSP
jgi:hypothetical protein